MKLKKELKLYFLLISIIALLTIVPFASRQLKHDNIVTSPNNANIVNYGFVSRLNDKIYYSNYSLDEKKLYSTSIKKANPQKVLEVIPEYLNIFQDKLVFSNLNDKGNIYLYDTLKKKTIKLNNVKSKNIIVSNGFIYYINEEDGNAIYKIDVNNNTNHQILTVENFL